jgi:hypothetical protein
MHAYSCEVSATSFGCQSQAFVKTATQFRVVPVSWAIITCWKESATDNWLPFCWSTDRHSVTASQILASNEESQDDVVAVVKFICSKYGDKWRVSVKTCRLWHEPKHSGNITQKVLRKNITAIFQWEIRNGDLMNAKQEYWQVQRNTFPEMNEFSKNPRTTQNSRRRNGDAKQVPYWVPTIVRRYSKKFVRHGDLAPLIRVPLLFSPSVLTDPFVK